MGASSAVTEVKTNQRSTAAGGQCSGVYGSPLLIIQSYRKVAHMPSYKYEIVKVGWIFEEQKRKKHEIFI